MWGSQHSVTEQSTVQNVTLCHWVNNLLKHHSVFIFRLRHFFSSCSTLAEESTMILHNAGNYWHTDGIKSRKTWIISNETNSNCSLRRATIINGTQSLVWTACELILVSGPPIKSVITLHTLCTVRLQMNGLAFSHLCDTKCYHRDPLTKYNTGRELLYMVRSVCGQDLFLHHKQLLPF
jgi:hypothetical protein